MCNSYCRAVMNLLDITPYLDAIERLHGDSIYDYLLPHEQYLSKLHDGPCARCYQALGQRE
eukprot:2992367-Heterocapsa_arctica.AAC.1